jgi:hypothetical protein
MAYRSPWFPHGFPMFPLLKHMMNLMNLMIWWA